MARKRKVVEEEVVEQDVETTVEDTDGDDVSTDLSLSDIKVFIAKVQEVMNNPKIKTWIKIIQVLAKDPEIKDLVKRIKESGGTNYMLYVLLANEIAKEIKNNK